MVPGVRGVRGLGRRASVPTASRRENGPTSFVREDSTWPAGVPSVSLGELSPPLPPVTLIFRSGALNITTVPGLKTATAVLAVNIHLFYLYHRPFDLFFRRRRPVPCSRAFCRLTRTIARASPSRTLPREHPCHKQHHHQRRSEKHGSTPAQRKQRQREQQLQQLNPQLILNGHAIPCP